MRLKKKKNHKKKALFPVLGILLIIVVCFMVEMISNMNILQLPEEQRCIYEPEFTSSQCEGFYKTGDQYILDSGTSGTICWELEKQYIGRIRYGIVSENLTECAITVAVEDKNGEMTDKVLQDNNPLVLTESIVKINEKTDRITLTLTCSEGDVVSITDPVIDNTFTINWKRVAIIAMLLTTLLIMIWFYQLFVVRIEWGFAIIAFVTGLSMLLCLPATKVGWDEEIHFRNAYELSLFFGPENVSKESYAHFAVTEYNWPLNLPGNAQEQENLKDYENNSYENADQTILIGRMYRGIQEVGNTVQGLAILIVKKLGASFSGIYFWGRFAGLLSYVVLMFLAIKVIPVGRKILTFISLMPTSVFLAVCFTYDTLTFCLIVLGVALILREWLAYQYVVREKWILLAYFCILAGSCSKLIYAPVMLIAWLIPGERYRSRKSMVIMRALSFSALALLLIDAILPTFTGVKDMSDSRGGDVSSSDQISYIISHPFAYIGILCMNVFRTFPSYCFGAGCYRVMGHLVTAGFTYLIPAMAIALIFLDNDGTEKIKLSHRCFILILLAVIVVLIWTAIYISFNETGVTIIQGVQGRYYRPLLPLLYLILSNRLIKVKLKEHVFNAGVLAGSFLIVGVTALQVMETYCG